MRTLYRSLIGATLAVPVILLAQSKPAAPVIDDAAIVGIFDIANTWDIATGTLASTKAASKEVKDFGTMLARDHKVVQDSGRAAPGELLLAAHRPRASGPLLELAFELVE